MPLRTIDNETVFGAIGMKEAIDAVRRAFIDFDSGLFEMPTRLSLGDGDFLFMPTHHRPTHSAVVKSLSLDFDRVPAIAGTLTWVELSHDVSLVIDAEAVTALRTGAAVGVATDLLASPEASRLAMFGAGRQALHQIRAVNTVRPLTQVRIVDLSMERAECLAASVEAAIPDAAVTVEGDSATALADAQIVNCATTSHTALFSADALCADVHVNAIGAFKPGMREIPEALLAQASVVVDDPDSALSETSEIIEAVASGAVSVDDLLALGHVLKAPFTRTPRTVFKSVGIAAQDWAIARLISASVI